MPKIRTVKPDLFRHEKLYEAEQLCNLPLRLAFVALFTCCDREGRFRWRPRQLKLDTLPYDNFNMGDILNTLHAIKMIEKFEKDGEFYGYIPSWRKHQNINHREPKSQLPDPDTGTPVQASEMPKSAPIPTSEEITKVLQKAQQKNESLIPMRRKNFENKADSDLLTVKTNVSDKSHFAYQQSHAHNTAMPVHAQEIHGHASVEVEVEMEVEKEMEMEVEKNKHFVAQARPSVLKNKLVFEIFEHWRSVMNHPQSVLDKNRSTLIRRALHNGYSKQQLCDAITGCSLTPHNMGDNDRGERYDGLHIILRSSDQIDRFIANYKNPPRSSTASEKIMQQNVTVAEHWLAKQMIDDVVCHAEK